MNKAAYQITLPMLSSMNSSTHLTLFTNYKAYCERYLSNSTLDEIGFKDVFLGLYSKLYEANNKESVKTQMKKRSEHLIKADKYFRQIRKLVSAHITSPDDKDIVESADIIYNIISSSGDITKKGINDKIRCYKSFTDKLCKHADSVDKLGMKKILAHLIKETEGAAAKQIAIDAVDAVNLNKKIKDIRPYIDYFYRNAMNILNSKIALGRITDDIKSFLTNWEEKVIEYRNQFAVKSGANISRRKKKIESNESESENKTKKEKHFTLSKSRDIKLLTKTSKTESFENTESEDTKSEINEFPLWTSSIDYTKMQVGDKVKTLDGRIWEALDLGQVHRDPTGAHGHFGWKLVA